MFIHKIPNQIHKCVKIINADFKLLGLDIDNKLEKLGSNYDKAHVKAQNIISNWKARKLPINERITISKCLIISQFNYVTSILTPTQCQVKKSQTMSDNFIRDSHRHWISDQRLYAPPRLGGLNCIELNSFFYETPNELVQTIYK